MRQMMKKLMLLIAPFFLWLGMCIPTYAMTEEEKELFDMLGVEYSLDDNGNFKEFQVDVNMERMSYEQKKVIAEKYKDISKVGNYNICISMGENADDFYMEIADKDFVPIYLDDNCCTSCVIFVNQDGSFCNIGYEDASSGEVINYHVGNMKVMENGCNPITSYEKQSDGSFIMSSKNDGDNLYSYDESGNLESRQDLATGITYNAEDEPIRKKIDTTDTFGLYSSVPYSVADEVQRLVDENNGSFYIYVEEADCSTILPEIQYLIMEGQRAAELGISLEEYREQYNIYEEVTVVMPSVMMDIFEEEEEHLWNETEPVSEEELPTGISEEAIAAELTKLINDYRVANGLEPLDTSDALLQQVADLRAEEATYVMDGGHSRPMAGKAADSFHVGENLAMTHFNVYDSSEEIALMIFNAWKASKGHNANMLREEYKQGAIGVKLVKEDGGYAAYASHDFSRMSDYENTVSETTKQRIAIGPQVPGNVENVEDYYEQLYHGNMPEDAQEEEPEKEPYEGVEVVPYGPQILDENGNKFQLPNGEEWTEAKVDFQIWEDSFTDKNGTSHDVTTGRIYFYTGSGKQAYIIELADEVQDIYDAEGHPLGTIFYLNNISGDTIVLKQCEYRTVSDIFPGGYDGNYASENCYYILNGETIEDMWNQ